MGPDPERARCGLRLAITQLATVVALVGGGIRGWRALVRHRALSSLAASAPGAPNVLIIVLDTVRRASLHLYGYPGRTTPELDRRVAESVVVDHAITPAPWTLPSHASLFTGRQPGSLGADWLTPLAQEPLTLAEAPGRGHGHSGRCGRGRFGSGRRVRS